MEAISVIKLASLKPWYSPPYNLETELNNIDDSSLKFGVSSSINSKIFLCQGGVSQFELDCIVLPINEMIVSKSPLALEVHQAAGSSLMQHYKNLKEIKTGNVVLGSGFHLPSRFIIHAMEPGMNAKFKNAVENALHRCYHNAMETAVENNLKTIGFVSLYESVTYLLNEEMAHMALGTVRCFLDKHNDDFHAVVFSVSKDDLDLYLRLLPAYFPRSVNEGREAAYLVALRNLSEWGDKIDADRAIRITHIPLHNTQASDNYVEDPSSLNEDEHSISDSSIGTSCDKTSFSSMDGDHDKRRRRQMTSMNDKKLSTTRERVYQRLLRLARTEDLSLIAETRCLYLCGYDRQADPLVVIIANRINLEQMNADKALLLFIRTVDPVVNGKYSIVYFHTLTQPHNHPPIRFIKRVYNVLDDRYKENLKSFYMVHSSVASRVFTWFFATFSASDVKRQIVTIKNIPQLYKYIAPDQIHIPPFVSDYDLKVNREVYQKEVAHSNERCFSPEHCEL